MVRSAVAARNRQLRNLEAMSDREYLILLRNRLVHTYRVDVKSPFVVRLQQIIEGINK